MMTTEEWQKMKRDAWVRFAAAQNSPDVTTKDAAKLADEMLAEFDARIKAGWL